MVSKKDMKKILVLSAGRSDYDRYYPIISELNKIKKVKLWLCLTKSHQENVFGNTIKYMKPHEKMGSHYPSDIKAGKKLGYMIGDKYE